MASVVRNEVFRRLTAAALRILAVAAAWLVAGRIGLLQQVVVGGAKVAPLWPPTGIALTCLLILGLRVWPGIAIGTLLVIATIGPVNGASLAIAAGNSLAVVCSCLMLRAVGFRIELDRLRDGVALVFLGALAGMLISATVGSLALLLVGSLPASGFCATWSAWWVGDAMGVLVITPLLLALHTFRRPTAIRPYQWAEPPLLVALTAVVALIGTRSTLHLLFLAFPVLIWAALRYQLMVAAPCVLVISVIAVRAAVDGVGPFAGHSTLAVMFTLQALNGAAALTALLLSALIAEQRNTYFRIEQACVALAEVVARLAPGEEAHRWPPAEDGDEDRPGRG